VEPAIPVTLYAAHRIDGPLNSVQRSFLQCVRATASESLASIPVAVPRSGAA
jgi:hypothetical protein